MRSRLETRHRPRCLLNGLRVTVRNWHCLLSAGVVCIAFGLLAGSPLASKIAPKIAPGITAAQAASLHPSQFSRQLADKASNVNARSLKEFTHHLEPATRSAAKNNRVRTALGATLLGFTLFLFILAATLPMYLAEERPRFRVLLKSGRGYFWRLLRALIFTAMAAVPLLAGLIGLRALLLQHVSKICPGRTVFLYSAISAGAILAVALMLLLWADLVEVYTVRNAMLGNPRVRQALLPALRILGRQFLRILPSFLFAGVLGGSLLAASLFLWKALVLSNHLWLAYTAAQTGLLLLLTARFWQHGMEAALIVAVDRSGGAAARFHQFSREISAYEPTLQDLVLKLKEQPWAKPDSALLNAALFPSPSKASQETRLADHAKKITLLDALTEETAPVPFSTGADLL